MAQARAEASAAYVAAVATPDPSIVRHRDLSPQVASPEIFDAISPIGIPENEISPFSTPNTSLNVSTASSSRESVVLSTILANHQHLFGGVDAGGVSPFMTKIPNLEGNFISAMVIPFPRVHDHSEVSQILSYSKTLSIMANAMLTMGSLFENQQRSLHARPPPPPPPAVYVTPTRIRTAVPGMPYITPSPIIKHCMFT